MDIISLGGATKAAMEEGKTRKQTLEVGVKGQHDNVAKRLEALEAAYGNSVKKANELIVKDAVNIMKAHARLNVIAQSKKYKMENMIFDDLLDLSGVDTTKSSGYTHEVTAGRLYQGIIQTKEESLGSALKKAILNIETSFEQYGYKFNGVNQAISVPYVTDLAPTDGFFCEVDAEADWSGIGTSKVMVLVSKAQTGGYSVALNDANTGAGTIGFILRLNGAYKTIGFPTSLLTGRHIIKCEYKEGFMRIFLDGVLQKESNVGVYPVQYSLNNAMIIGADAGSGTAPEGMYFPGSIYNVSVGRSATQAVRFYFDGKSATLISSSVAGIQGTILNTPLLVTDPKSKNEEPECKISLDGGVSWQKIVPDTLMEVDSKKITGNKLVVQMVLKNRQLLNYYGLTWT